MEKDNINLTPQFTWKQEVVGVWPQSVIVDNCLNKGKTEKSQNVSKKQSKMAKPGWKSPQAAESEGKWFLNRRIVECYTFCKFHEYKNYERCDKNIIGNQ